MTVASRTLALMAVLCLALLASQRAVADDKDTAYTVIIKKVEVQKTKPDGSSWDINDGRPDLCVIVRNVSQKDSKEFETKTRDDTFSAEFNQPSTIKVRPGQTLEFEVVDKDVAVNDSIGKIRREMTADRLKEGKMRLEKFGRVIFLEVELKKL
jgi:hypothetical protein